MTSPLRVLVLNERDPRHPRAGGAEVHVAEISKRLDAPGFEVTQLACSFPGAPDRERIDGMDVRRLGGIPAYYLRVVPWTARATARGEFDVVVEHLNKVPFCAAAYSRKPVLAVNHHLFGKSAFLQVAWPVATARLAVCPSVKEGWGITVTEANALGVPVVATDAPGLRDAVRDGETGVLVPDDAPEAFSKQLADAIEALIEDPVRLARLASEARAWARRFDWDASGEQMARAIESAAGR